MMNPSPTEIVDLFVFVEVTLIQYATVAGHFPGVNAASVKPKPKRANKVEVTSDEPSRGDAQVNAANPTTPKPKPKAQAKASPQATPTKVEGKPPGAKKDGKGGGKGKRGKSEPRVEKRKQQCIYFYRGTCQRGDQCKYEHQVGDDGNPVPVGPEIRQRFDDAVKRYNETRPQTQAKRKPAPKGGVTTSMLLLEPDDLQNGIVVSATQSLDDDEFYAMLDSGTNAIIVPLHPRMEGEVAECQVPSATVTGPIVQVYEFEGQKRLVVALPTPAILVSQEWLTNIAGWTFVSGPKPRLEGSACEYIVYRSGATKSYRLSMKNGLPDLSKELFWMGMHNIARKAKRISGHTLDELQEMPHTMAREPKPQIYAVKTIVVQEPSNVVFTAVPPTKHFAPKDVRKEIVKWFEHSIQHPSQNRGRLSGSAASLTFGAQTGKGSDRSCVIKRTLKYDYQPLITLVHQMAQHAAGSALPYLGFQILRLGPGQNLNQPRDYHNHAEW